MKQNQVVQIKAILDQLAAANLSADYRCMSMPTLDQMRLAQLTRSFQLTLDSEEIINVIVLSHKIWVDLFHIND